MVVRATTSTTATAPFNVLDVYTGAVVAFSLRRLSGAYSGAAVRVRRSSDNVEQDIGFDASGNLNESALTSFVGANSAFVATWYDQSGNARNAVQANAALQPRIVNAGVVDKANGKPAAISSANGVFLRTAPFTVLQPYTALAAANIPTNATIYDSGFSNFSTIYASTANLIAFFNGGDLFHTSSVGFNSYIGVANGAATEISKNLETPTIGNSGGNGLNGVTLMSNYVNNAFANTVLAELIIYPSALPQRSVVNSNIISYYGIA